MRVAFLIVVGYAALGFLYLPSVDALVAFTFVTMSSAPLLLAGSSVGSGASKPFSEVRPAVYWGLIGLGLFNLTMIAISAGRPWSDVLSIEGIIRIAAESTSRRYQLREASASGNPLLLALSLWLVFRIGTTIDRTPGWKQFLPIVPVAFYALLSTEKWPLFLTAVFFFAGLFIAYPIEYSGRKAIRYLLVLTPPYLAIGFGAMLLRGSDVSLLLAGDLLHYVFAPYPALGQWLLHGYEAACCTLGSLTFIGPLDAVGVTVRESGVFSQSVMIREKYTNIYTVFRYVVQDFSLVGPFLMASWLAAAHASLRALGSIVVTRQLECFAIFCALLSQNVTPFVHNTTALGIALALLSTLGLSLRLPPPQSETPAASDAGLAQPTWAGVA